MKRKKKITHLDVDVPFHDLDGMNIVWHGHYYKYFEYARTAFLRSIGFDIPQMKRSGYIWPVIESHCRYIAPMRYGMRVHIKVAIADAEHRVKFTYAIFEKKGGRRLAYGHTIQAAVDGKTGELCLMTPDVFLRHLR